MIGRLLIVLFIVFGIVLIPISILFGVGYYVWTGKDFLLDWVDPTLKKIGNIR